MMAAGLQSFAAAARCDYLLVSKYLYLEDVLFLSRFYTLSCTV